MLSGLGGLSVTRARTAGQGRFDKSGVARADAAQDAKMSRPGPGGGPGGRTPGAFVHLSLTHLSTFVAVVQHGSMTTASMTLMYSLSTVSEHVTRLERQLQVSLLHRTADGCVPTQEGRRLARRAAAMLDLHDEIVADTACVDEPVAVRS